MPSLLFALMMTGCSSPALSVGEAPALAPRNAGVVRLAVLGDTGKGNDTQAAVAGSVAEVCARSGCDAVVLLGDLLYPRGMDAPDDPRAQRLVAAPYASAADRTFLALGNHDYGHGRSRQKAGWVRDWAARTPGIEHPGDAYTVDLGIGSLHVLDTNLAFQWGGQPQRDWLVESLPAVEGWRVVAGHHPFRSDGPHGNAGSYEGWSGIPFLSGRTLVPLFEQGLCPHADVYLAGHDHSLQLLEHCGVQLLVVGAGAGTTPIVDRGNDPAFAMAEAGFAWLELHADGTGVAVFYDANGSELARETLTRRLRGAP